MAAVPPLEPGEARVLTNPLRAFLRAVGDAMRLNKPSLVMYGESRNGKSTALSELEESALHAKTWLPFRYYTEPFEQQGRAPKFFRGFRSRAASTGARFEVGSELDKLINSIRLACKQMETKRVLLLLDEVQDLPNECLLMLKTLTDRLTLDHNLVTFTLSAGQPQLVTRRDELMLDNEKRMYNDLVARFFTTYHRFAGLTKADVPDVLRAFDEPRGDAPSCCEHLIPGLVREQGWRMLHQLDPLWAELSREARNLSSTPEEGLEVGTEYVVRAAKALLVALSDNPSLAGKRALYEKAVVDSGFAAMYVPVGASEKAARARYELKRERVQRRGRK
jgi:hypothetical protein